MGNNQRRPAYWEFKDYNESGSTDLDHTDYYGDYWETDIEQNLGSSDYYVGMESSGGYDCNDYCQFYGYSSYSYMTVTYEPQLLGLVLQAMVIGPMVLIGQQVLLQLLQPIVLFHRGFVIY